MLPAMSCALLTAEAFVCNVRAPHFFFQLIGRNGRKNTYALLPHVAEDEIASSDDDSSDSEGSVIEVDGVRVPAPPAVGGEVRADELDVYQLTDKAKAAVHLLILCC